MKTVGDLNLMPGDVVKREDGTLGVVVRNPYGDADSFPDVCVWWHHESEINYYRDRAPVAWEVVPKPVPTVASLGLTVGDVVRWGGHNHLVTDVNPYFVWLRGVGNASASVDKSDPVPEGFRKVVIE